uniref:Uncharacterized protein n=1 Tax=Amphimedon queenslandica TaxID=400682 RepID=A0A1X7UGI8_AMPQE
MHVRNLLPSSCDFNSITLFCNRQAVIIAGYFKEALDNYGFKDVAVSMQDFLICIEMLAFAIAFCFFFSHKPYIDRAAAQVPCLIISTGMLVSTLVSR